MQTSLPSSHTLSSYPSITHSSSTLFSKLSICFNMEEALIVQRLSEDAILPTRGSEHAAGYDLSAAHAGVVPARGKALIKTNLAMAIPPGCYGRVAPRSGLAWKKSLDVGAGVIDADYRGDVGVILFNFSDEDVAIGKGDRIAQLVLERIATPPVVEADSLPASGRGAGGFGSTGVKRHEERGGGEEVEKEGEEKSAE